MYPSPPPPLGSFSGLKSICSLPLLLPVLEAPGVGPMLPLDLVDKHLLYTPEQRGGTRQVR